MRSVKYVRSEIYPSVDRDSPRSGGCGDPSKDVRVDIGIRISPHRMIENVNRIGANCKTLGLADPNSLAQCRIEPKVRWAGIDSLSRVAGRTRLRILKNNVSRTIHHDLVGKAARQVRVASKIRQRRALCLESREKL